MTRPATIACTLALAAVTAGCVPKSITLNFESAKGSVKQSTVLGPSNVLNSIAQIDLVGTIGVTSLGASGIDIDDTALMLRTAASDPTIRAVILRIDSPGGGVAASETLYNLVKEFKQTSGKPVVISMGNVAASGGYYIAMAGDTIYAQPSTVTGSVGVIIPTINASAGLNRIGVQSTSLTSGPNKDLGSPVAPINEQHQAILQSLVDDFYDQFRSLVLQARPDITDPNTTLDGRVFTGRQALEAGLVDHLGGIPEAFEAAKALAGIERINLVKLYRTSNAPATPYASVTTHTPQQPNTSTLPWPLPAIDRNTSPGIYYLWLPPATLASP
ncbi:MAG: signal peptide peptidase SppA [Planctomycetota bacterium]